MPFDAIVVRPCKLEDADMLALVASSTFLEAFAGVLAGDDILAHCLKNSSASAFERYLAAPQCQAFLACTVHPQSPIGYAMLTRPDLPLDDLGEDDLELRRIYLFSRFYGSGAGQKLMSHATDAAVGAGARRLLLGVHAGNARALAFYRRNGFEDVGTRTFQVGSQMHHDLVLGKVL